VSGILEKPLAGKVEKEAVVPLLAGLVILVVYLFISWPEAWVGNFSDSVDYLLLADQLNPWIDQHHRYTGSSRFPPLYPLLLGLTGVDADHLRLAQFVTTTIWLLALAVMYRCARQLGAGSYLSSALTLNYALLPATLVMSFLLLSESLSLLIILISVLLLDRPSDRSNLTLGVLAIALAILARTAAIALLPALAIYLLARPTISKRPWLFLLAAVPPVLRIAISSTRDGGHGYLTLLIDHYRNRDFSDVASELAHATQDLVTQWLAMLGSAPIWLQGVWLLLGGIGMLGALLRLRRFELGPWFLFGYLALIVIWPYPHERARLLHMATPLILLYSIGGWRTILVWARQHRPRMAETSLAAALLLPTLLAVPILTRLLQPVPEALIPYTRTADWVSEQPMEERLAKMESFHRLVIASQAIGDYLSPDDCVYAVFTNIVMFYAEVQAVEPPGQATGLEDFPVCDHFLFFARGGTQRHEEPGYPMSVVGSQVRPLFVSWQPSPQGQKAMVVLAVKQTMEEPPVDN
jgi:hypothetical protein